jgi:hypothetical protein
MGEAGVDTFLAGPFEDEVCTSLPSQILTYKTVLLE